MVDKKVWVVDFCHCDFSDLNGVFSTREKAEQRIANNVVRCSWTNADEVNGDKEECIMFNFLCMIERGTELVLLPSVKMYLTEIE